PDPPPTVTLQRPTSSQSLLPDARVTFQMIVEDEIFAVRSTYLEYRRKNAENHWLDEQPMHVPIYDPARVLTVAKIAANVATNSQLSTKYSVLSTHSPLTTYYSQNLRPQRLERPSRWPLNSQFKEGETIVLQV